MWSAFFGYSGFVAAAMTARLIVLLVAGPWLVLVMASAPPSRSRAATLAKAIMVVLLLDRMMVDFRFWGPIAVLVPALRPTLKGSHLHTIAGCLIAGAVLAMLIGGLGPVWWLRYAAWLFIVAGLLADLPPTGVEPVAAKADGVTSDSGAARSPWLGQLALSAAAALPLAWCTPELEWPAFPLLLMTGVAGWLGVQFLCWRLRQQARPRRWPLRVGSLLSGLAAGLLFAVLMGEAYFRYVYDASDANTDLRTFEHWEHRHVQFNTWGYRDREFPPVKQLDALSRIVILGDSFAFGMGIDNPADLLGPRLEAALATRVSPPPRVFTLAHNGLDTREELAMFRRDGVRLRPRVVVLMYHVNDTDKLVPWPLRRWTPAPIWWPITDNSDFLQFFHYRVFVSRQSKHLTVHDLPGLGVYQQPALFARQSADLLALMSAIREAGATPVVVLYPYLSAPTDAGPQRVALDRVADVLATAGVPCLDVSRLVNVNDRRFHANRFDPHPSPALHTAVAPTLAEVVIKAGFAPTASAPASAPATAP